MTLDAASARLADTAFDRAMNSVDDVVFDGDRNHVYTKRKYNDRLLMFLLRAHVPGGYRHAHLDTPGVGAELSAGSARPVGEALELLGPEPPAEPQKRMSPEAPGDALDVPDIMDGKLPHWQDRDQDCGTEEEDAASAGPQVTRLTAETLQAAGFEKEKDNEGQKTAIRENPSLALSLTNFAARALSRPSTWQSARRAMRCRAPSGLGAVCAGYCSPRVR